MSYQVALNSRNVLAPVTLEDALGRRYNAPLSGLDMASAMVIRTFASGTGGPGLAQDVFPLRASTGDERAYAGQDWELRAQKVAGDWHVYYLGIPDRFFAPAEDAGREAKSISVEIIGSSPMTGRQEFSGGVDLNLQARVELPLIPGFLNLAERFFPTLLPANFIESYAVDGFEFNGRRELLLAASLQTDPADRLPVSLGKHWDPKNWISAVVENLGAGPGYFTVKGGCFFTRNRKVTHWFSAGHGARGIGLEERGFRAAAAEKIKGLGVDGNGAWIFWLEPQGVPAAAAASRAGLERTHPQPRFSLRHPMLHRMLHFASTPGEGGAPLSIANLPAETAVAALAQTARVLAAHQAELHQALSEPSPALWSRAAEGGNSQDTLAGAIRALYSDQGEALRTLEAVFDETSGYAAWDAQANPMRELFTAYLTRA